MIMDTTIFKAYDIRGIVPTQLNGDMAELIGRAYAVMSQKELGKTGINVVVGNDMRLSMAELKARLIKGLTEQGANVIDIGLASTPTFYYAVARYGYDGGIQVSASHNPKEYNGFKLVRDRSRPIGRETGMKDLRNLVEAGAFPSVNTLGKISQRSKVVEELVADQTADINRSLIRPFKIVVDAANAMGALDIEAMFAGTPCNLIRMNFELDGSFPVHQPDPLDSNNLKILQSAVLEHRADLGIAPDGDGDRYFFVDNTGEVIRQEILRGLMAQLALREYPGATVCYDIRPGRITRDMIAAAGGKPVVTPVGHSLIKKVMLDVDAVFGGESSGHYFYRFPYGTFESPVALTMKLLAYLSQQNKPLSEVIAPYKKYSHSGEINSEVSSVPEVLERIKRQYRDADINLLDGVTIEYSDWWFNVRGSNTEPLIRLNLEAKSPELMAQKRDEILSVIRQ